MKATTVAVLIASALAIGACSQTASVTNPSSTGIVTPPRVITYSVAGYVEDPLGLPVSDASIAISDAAGQSLTLTTDGNGIFRKAGVFTLPIDVQASKAGLRSYTATITRTSIGNEAWIELGLEFDGQTVNVRPGN